MTVKFFDTTEAVNKLIAQHQGFIAFNQEDFEKQANQAVKYTSVIIGGFYIPAEDKEIFLKHYHKIFDEKFKFERENNDKEEFILHFLLSEEAFYTYDLQPTYERLKIYGYSYNDIKKVFDDHKANYD